MKRATTMLGALALAAVGFLFAAPAAEAQVTCANYSNNNKWPSDGTHYKVCFSYQVGDAEDIRGQMNKKPSVGTLLQNKDAFVYFFQNRAAADLYFLTNNFDVAHQDSSGRCGNTAYGGGKLITAIYKNCTFKDPITQQEFLYPNPDFRKVAAHEKGHAFAIALALDFGNPIGPDKSYGFKTLGNNDKVHLNSISGTKCTLFGTAFPSDFERELGAPNDQVCTNSTTVATDYIPLSNSQIANIRAPYFLDPATPGFEAYEELWAQQFSILDAGVGGPHGDFDMIDKFLGDDMRCTFHNVTSFYHTNKPVGTSNNHPSFKKFPTQWNCPSVTEAQLRGD